MIRIPDLRKLALPLLSLLLVVAVAACSNTSVGNKPLASAASAPTAYNLGFGDRIAVTIYGEKDLTGEYEVDDSGSVAMPLVGAVKVADMQARDAEKAIARQLTAKGLVKDANVNVAVVRYRPVYIMGEVQRPGAYPYYSGITVMNMVALAGGYTYRASKGGIGVVRPTESEKEPQKAPETAYLAPGDIVIVPERWF